MESVQCFGKKKTSTAVAHCKTGKGLLKINGSPIALVQPELLRLKVYEPILICGLDKFSGVDIRVTVSGGGHVSQIYAIRQAIAKAIVAYYQKYVDEQSKNELKKALIAYDRSLLVADPRRAEPKKPNGKGARSKSQVRISGSFEIVLTNVEIIPLIVEIVVMSILRSSLSFNYKPLILFYLLDP